MSAILFIAIAYKQTCFAYYVLFKKRDIDGQIQIDTFCPEVAIVPNASNYFISVSASLIHIYYFPGSWFSSSNIGCYLRFFGKAEEGFTSEQCRHILMEEQATELLEFHLIPHSYHLVGSSLYLPLQDLVFSLY